MTLITGVIVVTLTFLYGLEFFLKKNSITSDNELTNDDVQYVHLTNKIYPFMARLEYPEGSNLPNGRFQINAFYGDLELQEDSTYKYTCNVVFNTLKSCAFMPYKDIPEFSKDDLRNYLCIDFENIQKQCAQQTKNPKYEVKIGGFSGDKQRSRIVLQVSNYKLNAAGEAVDIVEASRFEEKSTVWLHIRYPSFSFNSQLAAGALKTVLKRETQNILETGVTYEHKFFKKVTLLDDYGWLLANIRKKESIELDENKSTSFGPYFSSDGKRRLFYQTLFYINQKELVFNRRFMKLQDLAALIYGSVKIVVSINFFVAMLFAHRLRQQELVDKFFTNEREAKVEMHVMNSIVSKNADFVVKENKKRVEPVGFFEQYLQFWKMSKVRSNALEFFKRANEYIKARMDVCSFLDLFEKFSRLSEMLLSEDQLQELLFERKTIITSIS